MYKMIVVDLDGTLLNDYKEISRENIELIERAYNEKGIITVIATGRPPKYVNEICSTYGNCFGNYIIACNGAAIKNMKTDKYIYKVTFTNKEVLELREIFLEENADYIILHTDEKTTTEVSGNKDLTGAGISKSEISDIAEEITKEPNFANLLCTIGGETEVLEKVIKKIEKLDGIKPTVICNYLHKTEEGIFESRYIDVTKAEVSKKNAIHILAEALGIKQEEIIVIGDGGNDIPMFECAGLKVAMENAEEYLKEKADFITTSNNDSGVAKAIQKFIFEQE